MTTTDRPTASTITDDQLDALRADLERARRVAVALENENARLKDRTKEAKEQARVATIHAHRLQQQTPDAAQRTLDSVRKATSWGDLWVQLGFYYGLKPEECGTEARARRLSEVRRAEQRAERAEQQLAAVRALHTSSQETRGVGRGSPWRPYCDHCHQDWPCATVTALDGAQQPAPAAEPQHATRGTNAEDCPACTAGIASGTAPAYPWLCPGPTGEGDR